MVNQYGWCELHHVNLQLNSACGWCVAENHYRLEEFTKTLSEKGIESLYGLVRDPEETEEHLRERLRIFLLSVRNAD